MAKEKWKTVDYGGDPDRYVVDQDGVLIADCYADTGDDLSLPDDYIKLAKRIALLPVMERALRDLESISPQGNRQTAAAKVIEKLDRLKP